MKFTFPPESRPLPGFTIKRAIYRGGFGEVYYAITDAGREVALKLLQNNSDIELRGVQQCLNLSHPHLVTIFDIRQDADGDHWIVMEYIAGETLDAAIRKYPQGMPVETVRKWLPGLADGIEFLHRRGLVHRDLKPANVFLDGNVVKIGDVGLSKFIAPSQRSAQTQSVGTVYYMAPEVAKGCYGKEVDVYAAGVMLFEMLTGDVPFDGESTGEILMKHLTAAPDLSRLPPRLRPVIGKALQKSPEQRYAGLPELQRAFDAAVLGKEDAAPEVTAEPRSKRPYAESRDFYRPTHNGELPAWGRKWDKQNLFALGLVAFVLPMLLLGVLRAGRLSLGIVAIPGVTFAAFAFAAGVFIAIKGSRMAQHSQRPPSSTLTANNFQQPPAQTRIRPPVLRFSQACGAASLLAPITIVLSGLLATFKPSMFAVKSGVTLNPGLVGFFVLVAISIGWGAMFLAWLQAQSPRVPVSRWVMAVVGAGIGLAAWGIDQYLLIDLSTTGENRAFAILNRIGEHPLIDSGHGPTLVGYVAFFVGLFGLRSWTKLTALDRPVRFSVGAVVKTLVLAWIVTWVVAFPVPWGIAWGAVAACALQLSSPWQVPSRRSGSPVPSHVAV
ncbi:serine/threonine-protein kinase [Planctomicrobium piriforme]|uniref:Serine/threonine protein kinase n=1 Tax=Planctomicrobium piriforme TaxID=1576369 RepID=A0A1I3F815_9PLAN|nr:serine/threonine-protein kinase [Planctomicrobium piriforme]SFI07300.1 serine/threonine protein kinase [Planctomicrobium piriforme]